MINGRLDTTAAWLLEHGVDTDEPTSNGTALEYALREELFHEACRLIEMGASVSETAENSLTSRSSLHLAGNRPHRGARRAENIRYGRSPEIINYSSRVGGPFEEARINTVKLLLANGCKLKTENSHGRTPLESALHGGLPRTTVHLLDAGALSSGEDVWETL